jgi:hypothetical protein
MGSTFFDSYKAYKKLIAAGVSEAQAEAHVKIIMNTRHSVFSSKRDFDKSCYRITDHMSRSKTEISSQLSTISSDIRHLQWGIGIILLLVLLFS